MAAKKRDEILGILTAQCKIETIFETQLMIVGTLRGSMGGGLRIRMADIISILMTNIALKIYARISNDFLIE